MPDSYLVHVVTLFLAAALVLYVVLGGADFGAGILELFLVGPARRQERQLLQQAIGPVWEANHIWLIIALVILFNAFPAAFAEMSTTFHIPLTLMLVGITMRGSAYALRHYDDIRDGAQTAYERFFVAGSILTPLALGMVAGGLLLGRTDPNAVGFWMRYVSPWANAFALCVGLFLCSVCVFLAAVFAWAEAVEPELRERFRRLARTAHAAAVICGLFVFPAAHASGLPMISLMIGSSISLACVVASVPTALLIYPALRQDRRAIARLLAGLVAALILVGWLALQAPHIIVLAPGAGVLTIQSTAAPRVVLIVLVVALSLGMLLILPALAYLLFVFKQRD